jgi:8-oxo-dGTP pyrophosphatase MutT (NUDIX family)
MTTYDPSVDAAGGVPWRERDGRVEVLVVHRPAYDDWTFPKGKREPGETEEQTALREVEEETGLRCELGPELATTHYGDKRVRYWALHAPGDATPATEVDAIEWLDLDGAAGRLTYETDREVLRAFATAARAPDPSGG